MNDRENELEFRKMIKNAKARLARLDRHTGLPGIESRYRTLAEHIETLERGAEMFRSFQK